jgi:hypothetical protein
MKMFLSRFLPGSALENSKSRSKILYLFFSLSIASALSFVSCSDTSGTVSFIDEIYKDPESIDEYLYTLSEESDLVSYESLGYSDDGEYVISKVIISGAGSTVKPEVSIIGGIHGNESIAVNFPLRFIDFLVSSGSDEAQELLDNYEFHIIPAVNPWGLAHNTRYNANGVDLNRNFSWAWSDAAYHGEYAFDQIESQLVKADADDHHYILSIAYHSGEQCISTVWDYIGTTTSSGTPASYTSATFLSSYMPNGSTILSFASDYADQVNTSGDDSFYSVEGYDWYPTYGSLGDWFYGEKGAVAYTIELYDDKDADVGSKVWQWHKEPFISLFDIIEQRISGTVVDYDTGDPIEDAVVYATAVSKSTYADPVEYTLFGSSNSEGGFGIIADTGTYTLTIEADGYTDGSETFTVGGSESLTIELQLE